jgi:hypothetical protein
MVSVCSPVAVARAAVSEHWEGEFLSYPGSCARSGQCVLRSWSPSVAVARAMVSVYSEVEFFPGGCVRTMVSVC